MKATKTSSANGHPPLARDVHGNLVPIPDGTAAWRLMRQTTGRPRIVSGPDGQPLRFPLDLDAETLAEMCGRDTYRVYALDEVGNQLDYVTTVVAGADTSMNETALPLRNANGANPTNSSSGDLRFALETIGHMGRTYADALRAVTEAQADWVKTIAIAKGLPRNVALPPPRRETDEDDEDDEDDDDDDVVVARAPAPQSGVEAFLAHLGPLLPEFLAIMRSSYPNQANKPETTPARPPRNAAAAAPRAGGGMLHLAKIQARLSKRERQFLDGLLEDEAATEVAAELNRRSVDDAVAFIRNNIDEADAHSEGSAAAHAEDASAELDPAIKHKLFAAAALLGPDERVRLLRLKPRLIADAGLVAEVSALFAAMTPSDVAEWLRANLGQLEVRFAG